MTLASISYTENNHTVTATWTVDRNGHHTVTTHRSVFNTMRTIEARRAFRAAVKRATQYILDERDITDEDADAADARMYGRAA